MQVKKHALMKITGKRLKVKIDWLLALLLTTSCLYGKTKEIAVIETDKGIIKFEFYEQDAPNTVDNFKKLARKKFYNGLKFHRVVPNFVIQGGCPKGDGTGDPGYKIKAEFNKRPHLDGTVAMARAQDPDSAGSQFYICLGHQSFLDGKYTVFGQVISGLDVVHKIQIGDIMKKVYIIKQKIKIKN
ncbi:MAG: peptidyl-prolyl cis-trans isomerase [Elusimicrobia bacterium CG06_land_8_20_14_3_00_38_11]|nr:MAG: peptidyl-prolyl cis-trans isomerase [Elusimicrobia bacterium CG06_land_8_20_14_3_00_38_11]